MRRTCFMVIVGILVTLSGPGIAESGENGSKPQEEIINIGFSRNIFSDVNINDAVASIEVWAGTIAKSQGIPIGMKVTIFDTTDLLEDALANGQVDMVGLLTPEVLKIEQSVALDHLYATVVRQGINEEYLLLVRDQMDYADVTQLAGATLKAMNNGRCSLAIPWLESLLAQHGLPECLDHFDNIRFENRANMVILPVFFGKAESCLVTRNGFEIMTELNPQVGKTLRVIAQSPPYLPAIFCFRANFQSQYLDRILKGLDDLHTQPSGAQVLIVFRGDRLVRISGEELESARQLLKQ